MPVSNSSYDLDTILPGVTEAYAALRSPSRSGLQTSTGSFYNHTLFGRDASMAAKFVSDFDHDIVVETIIALAELQGSQYNSRTQEQPGRIHHEFRDFRTWKSTFFERIPFIVLNQKWDIRDRRLLSYFSLDTTSSYIRLVHKHATRIDRAILDRSTTNHHGHTQTIEQSIVVAAEWIMDKVNDRGLVGEWRRNPWSLPFQTFQDSLYARRDRSLVNYTDFTTYVEVQALAADALYDMAHLLPRHEKAQIWRETALRMHQSMIHEFSNEDGFLASAIDSRGVVDVANVSAGWTLNTSLWDEMSIADRSHHIGAIVERLFSSGFLTNVGLRTRSRMVPDPVKHSVDYHGSETVWPMFSFMVVEGLRRHRLYELAQQLENRIINGLNATGGFPEFHIVRRNGSLILPAKSRFSPTLQVHMKPEQNIAFSVVPGVVMARRSIELGGKLAQLPWQAELEKRVLEKIKHIDRADPSSAIDAVGPVVHLHLRRWSAGLRTMYYFWKEKRRIDKNS